MDFELRPELEAEITAKTEWTRILETPWDNLVKFNSRLEKREDFVDIRDWYLEQARLANNFSLEPSTLENLSLTRENTQGEAWEPVYSTGEKTQGQIKEFKRYDSKFFRLVGVRCLVTDPETGEVRASWHQPILQGEEVPFRAKIFGEKVEVPVYGLLALIVDSAGNYLLTTGQEAASENNKHLVVRMPIQASTSKVAFTEAGDSRGDKGLAELMKSYGCDKMSQVMDMAQEVLMETPSDPDRIFKHNLIMIMPPVLIGSEQHQKLTAGGKRKWVSREQFDMIVTAGLTNSPTEVTIDMAERAARLRNL